MDECLDLQVPHLKCLRQGISLPFEHVESRLHHIFLQLSMHNVDLARRLVICLHVMLSCWILVRSLHELALVCCIVLSSLLRASLVSPRLCDAIDLIDDLPLDSVLVFAGYLVVFINVHRYRSLAHDHHQHPFRLPGLDLKF